MMRGLTDSLLWLLRLNKGHKEIVEILIAKGADVNVMVSNDEGVDGFTPLVFAVIKVIKKSLKFLLPRVQMLMRRVSMTGMLCMVQLCMVARKSLYYSSPKVWM